jgi:peptide/nickel transport system ATP-binding protein
VTPLLDVAGLRTDIRTRSATVQAVRDVSFSIAPGETVGLVGESGCGKSMTGMSLMRLLPPGGRIAAGSIRLAGKELTTLSEGDIRRVRGNNVAMIFQDPMTSLNPTMTIGEQIAEPAIIHRGLSQKDALRRAIDVLDLVGMPKPTERLKAYPHQLSGGLRQRVVIATALVCEPQLLIADEPTTALDVTIQGQILTLLDRLKDELHMSMLLITHDLGVIAGRADRVMVMYAGQIVESSETGQLFASMRHPYTQALFESMPPLVTDRSKLLYSIPGMPPSLISPLPGCNFAPRCRYARDECTSENPPLAGDDPEHPYACFFPVLGPNTASAPVPGETPAGGHPDAVRKTPAPLTVRASDGGAESGSGARGPAGAPVLVLEHVVKEFPILRGVLQRRVGSVQAVSDVSLEIARGETFALVGESGCGKTTLGRLIVALERPDKGSIRFEGEEVSKLRGSQLRRKRQSFQIMFQDSYASLDPRARVAATLREPLASQHLGSRPDQRARIRALLTDVGLPESAMTLYPHEFSGGQRQRIGLARALVLEPKLIVADEPVSALDVSIQSQVLNLMRKLQAERDLTYVLISHDLAVVRYLADRVAVMYLGKLVEIGSGEEIYASPAHPYTAGLLESIPVPDPVQERGKQKDAVRGELPSAANPPSGCRFRTRCRFAQQVCADVEPPIQLFSLAGHRAACHFPLEKPLGVEASQVRGMSVGEGSA